MQTSPQGVAEIAGHEGIVLSPYRDSGGTWTFGVGHTSSAGAPDPAAMARGERRPISVALEVFRRDLAHFEKRVTRAVTVPLAQHEFDALVSFDFNTGGIFRARLTKRLNAGDRAGAAEAFDGWHRPPEIVSRRDREKRLFRDGVYAHSGMATIYGAGADGRVDWAGGTRINVLALLDGSDRDLVRPPDDPGSAGGEASTRPEPQPTDRVGLIGAAGAGLAALAAFLGKLALWVVILAAIAGVGFLAWRYRGAIGRILARLAGRGA